MVSFSKYPLRIKGGLFLALEQWCLSFFLKMTLQKYSEEWIIRRTSLFIIWLVRSLVR